MTLEEAHAADREERVEDAARLYEAALVADPGNADALVELVVLYWQATDYGVWKSKGINREFVGFAGKRFRELLGQGSDSFPGSPAIRFWAKYIAWADLGEPLDGDECRTLLRGRPEYLEPAMFLFAASQGSECESEARRLLHVCEQVGTSRCRYVVSVIEGVFKRRPRSEG